MIQVKPIIKYRQNCAICGAALIPREILWQGIHVCAVSSCSGCQAEIVGDLPVGHAMFAPFQVDVAQGKLYPADDLSANWYGEPLLRSLLQPASEPEIKLSVERFGHHERVIILNCIDFLYGHALLKLLNAEAHLRTSPELGLIVIVPHFLRWLVPDGVAEIWTVNISLAMAQQFFPKLDEMIRQETARFTEIYVSSAHSHPQHFSIARFSRVEPHDFQGQNFRITFIWREDRLWSMRILYRIARRIGLVPLLLHWQNRKVCRLFSLLRRKFPTAKFTVVGLGSSTCFPEWVDDSRVVRYDEVTERNHCRLYAESRLIIGVHGSNLLLPSAHGGCVINLMPDSKWSNFAQDILYQESDVRLSAWRYRYVPLGASIRLLGLIATQQLVWYNWFRNAMCELDYMERNDE